MKNSLCLAILVLAATASAAGHFTYQQGNQWMFSFVKSDRYNVHMSSGTSEASGIITWSIDSLELQGTDPNLYRVWIRQTRQTH